MMNAFDTTNPAGYDTFIRLSSIRHLHYIASPGNNRLAREIDRLFRVK
jgi:hypothetical protein